MAHRVGVRFRAFHVQGYGAGWCTPALDADKQESDGISGLMQQGMEQPCITAVGIFGDCTTQLISWWRQAEGQSHSSSATSHQVADDDGIAGIRTVTCTWAVRSSSAGQVAVICVPNLLLPRPAVRG